MNIKCAVCNRKISNLSTSHQCEDGSYVGPTCKARVGMKGEIPKLEALLLSKEEAEGIEKKIFQQTRDIKNTIERMEKKEEIYKNERGIPWDTHRQSIFTSPAHPDAISSIDLNRLVKFNKILAEFEEDDGEQEFEEITHDHIARAVHCFLKLFRDPGMNKEDFDLMNKSLGIQLVGVAPIGRGTFSRFIISSAKGPFAERAICLDINLFGDVNVRVMNLTNDGFETSEESELLMIVPTATRRFGGCANYQLIKAFVLGVFATDDPRQTPGFQKFFPKWSAWETLYSKQFRFRVPESSTED